MSLQDIIHNHHWLSIFQVLLEIDSELEECKYEYKNIINEVKQLEAEESTIILMIDRHWEDGQPTIHAHAYGFDTSIPKTKPTQYVALEWTAWSQWLGFKIDQDAIEEWTEIEIICHCLIEMTRDGITQNEIQNTINSMVSTVNTIKSKYYKDKLDNK